MIHQMNSMDPRAGASMKTNDQAATAGRKPVEKAWVFSMALMMLLPMASFEQVGRIRQGEKQSVAIHRTPSATEVNPGCCDLSKEEKEGNTSKWIELPSKQSIREADREMIRNHATVSEAILPAFSNMQFEEADIEMEVIFAMSNASWMISSVEADNEINERFQMDNLLQPHALHILLGDVEINSRFFSTLDPA